MEKLTLTGEVRKVAQKWPKKEITVLDVFSRVKPKFPKLRIVSIQNLMATHKKLFVPLRWDISNGSKRRIYAIAHGQPERRRYTTTLELGEAVYSFIEDLKERNTKLLDRLVDFKSMVEENKMLRDDNQKLKEELQQAKGLHIPNKDLGLPTHKP